MSSQSVPAVPAGSSEMAQALEAARRENARLRAEEAESRRLHKAAGVAGLHIRDQLTAEGVVTEAREIFENIIGSDLVYLYLINDGWIQPPVGHEHDWKYESSYERAMPEQTLVHLTQVFRKQEGFVIHDARTKEGEEIPAWLRQAIREAGVIAVLTVPFGVDETLLGYVALHRCREGWPFTTAEIDAVESIAADLGRGLYQARLYEKERSLVADLKALDRAKSDFITIMSHELRTPLTSIEGYLELLSDLETGPLSAQQREMVSLVSRNASRLHSLIEDVFELTKVESSVSGPERKPVNLVDVVAQAADCVGPSLAARELELDTQIPSHAVVVSANPAQLDQVLSNLLANAVKFTPEGGHIHVGVAVEDGGTAVVRVRDTGIGIPKAEQEHLFSRFFRCSNARDIPGTGLGLYIVHSIVTSHGGDISVSSEEGRGSTFTVRLPCTMTGWQEGNAPRPW
jgi:two-component system, OmpR family, phosphate regulon sensor histidine kinase PhoR